MKTLSWMGSERHKIAQKLGSGMGDCVDDFGKPRYLDHEGSLSMMTLLPGREVYLPCQARIHALVCQHLGQMLAQGVNTRKVDGPPFQNKISRFDIEIIENPSLERLFADKSVVSRLSAALGDIAPVFKTINPTTINSFYSALLSLNQNKLWMSTLKKRDLPLYKRFTQAITFQLFSQSTDIDSKKTKTCAWVTLRTALDINENGTTTQKMFPLSSYCILLAGSEEGLKRVKDFDGKLTAEYFKDHLHVIVVHHDALLLQDRTISIVAEAFKNAMECQHENLALLKQRIAYFSYLYAHATPYCRGSAAIQIWLERAIFAYHGYQLTYRDAFDINLEALSSWLDTYIQKAMSQLETSPL